MYHFAVLNVYSISVNALLISLLTNSALAPITRLNLEDEKPFFVALNGWCQHSLVPQWGDFDRAFRSRLTLLEVVSTATSSTTASVPVRDEVLATLTGTLRAPFVPTSPLWYGNDTLLATRSYDGMFWAQQNNLVIIQVLASRPPRRNLTTLITTYTFSLILPFASLVRGIILLDLMTISSWQ